MHLAQQYIGQLRRKRVLFSLLTAAGVLLLTLTLRFFEEKSRVQQHAIDFANSAMLRFDRLLSPLEVSANAMLPLIGQPCTQIRPALIKKVAMLQTIRSLVLVNHDAVYCSSTFGAHALSFASIYPSLAFSHYRLMLTTDRYLLKGSPILLFWTPEAPGSRTGILQVINIELMTNHLLEPQLPWVERAVFNVGGHSLEYGNPLIEPTLAAEDEVRYDYSSLRYPYTLTLYGPSPIRLALSTLPMQLPLALILSLLVGYIVWLATANRLSLSGQISHGLLANEFMVYCQPLVNAQNNACEGIELLLRWHNARHGWIAPDIFIPLAEQHNLIIPLTRFVLRRVVAQLPTLPQTADFHIAINVAASHFRDRLIVDDLQRLWRAASPLPLLMVELTERDALPVMDQRVIPQLHEIGVSLAIDDFGTGHSSLACLKDLRPDVLKIDKIFTAAIGTDAINATVIEMIISLAQRLNIRLVAEGVESAEQAASLRERGVDLLQGYYYARPMPIESFPLWLEQHQAGIAAADRLKQHGI